MWGIVRIRISRICGLAGLEPFCDGGLPILSNREIPQILILTIQYNGHTQQWRIAIMTVAIDPIPITTLVVVILAVISGFIWFSKLSSRVDRLERDVQQILTRVGRLEVDMQQVLTLLQQQRTGTGTGSSE